MLLPLHLLHLDLRPALLGARGLLTGSLLLLPPWRGRRPPPPCCVLGDPLGLASIRSRPMRASAVCALCRSVWTHAAPSYPATLNRAAVVSRGVLLGTDSTPRFPGLVAMRGNMTPLTAPKAQSIRTLLLESIRIVSTSRKPNPLSTEAAKDLLRKDSSYHR